MKKNILLTILSLSMLLGASSAFAQNVEMNRFNKASLEVKKNEIKLFPNPTISYLNVKIENSNLKSASFTVHNIIGNVVEVPIEKIEENNYRVKVEDLAPGYYFLAIRDKEGHFKETFKFLKRT
ncbi:T9SS type A sorting domain-containing protein [Fulvivirga ligni]|uniref:T9SS type A sorting domain-containing protein n=1 Tax=Fulvivirga ligni TaxID=2904246 RepID=UPI001F183686|nr:T9SS type A sorting domain-containing protein [Fulvivirga ligni]UII21279.1 T9SS type A sorting domain-containing protein [Fulvivirga ligni]